MPSVFLSYSREDLPLLKELEAQLKKVPDISIWRDQEKIYGGQKWPRVLGEAIADQDVILLTWSKNSATSHFVEFEWTTAIALKKIIIPCMLDSTPLPPSLAATQGIPVGDIPRLIAALATAVPSEDAGRRAEVVSKLDQVSATKPKEVLTAAKTIFDQRNWTVYGNVSQAGRDLHLHIPPSAQQIERRDRKTRALLNSVRQGWIEGCFRPNLKGSRPIAIHKTLGNDLVAHPLNVVTELPNFTEQSVPEGKPLIDIFDEATGFLLILGEPGAGKTITLLEVAVNLLDRAESDSETPVPVIFNLATWSDKWSSLTDWLVSELGMQYRVGKVLAQSWIIGRRLTLLLDGLDELRAESRAACVQAINRFLADPGVPAMVVCSRTREYSELQNKLRLNVAIQLHALTDPQIDQYLADVAGPKDSTIRDLVQSDVALRELAQSPLMLSIMHSAYSEAPEESLELKTAVTSEERHSRLFNRYVENMFRRKGVRPHRYTPEQVINGLSWLAIQMKKHSQTLFLLENVQPSWLVSSRERWPYWLLSRAAGAALIATCIAFGSLMAVGPELRLWSWKALGWFSLPVIFVILGALFGLILGTLAGMLDGLLLNPRLGNGTAPKARQLLRHLGFFMMGYGVIGSLWGALAMALRRLPTWYAVLIVGCFAICGLFPGLRSAKRTPETDIRTTETLRWSWSKAANAYLLGLTVYLVFAIVGSTALVLFALRHQNWKDILQVISGISLAIAPLLIVLFHSLAILYQAKATKLRPYLLLTRVNFFDLTDRKRAFRNLFTLQFVVAVLGGISLAVSHPKNTLGVAGAYLLQALGACQFFGFLFVLLGGLERRNAIDGKNYPNQGVMLSIKNSLITTLYVFLVCMFLFVLPMVALILYIPVDVDAAGVAAILMLYAGTLACTIGAWFGVDVVQHYVLRAILYWKGLTPRRYVQFLDYAVSLIFLRKVGGGYVFIHRLVLEHFAKLSRKEERPVVL
jgi:hypothetical protein